MSDIGPVKIVAALTAVGTFGGREGQVLLSRLRRLVRWSTLLCIAIFVLVGIFGTSGSEFSSLWLVIALLGLFGSLVLWAYISFSIWLTKPANDESADLLEPVQDDYHITKLEALLRYDEDLARAAKRIRPFGQKWLDEFERAYLAINDKSYLPSIVRKIVADAKQEQDRKRRLGPPKVVREGLYRGRRWRLYNDASFEAQLLSGEFKGFADLEEFKAYIS